MRNAFDFSPLYRATVGFDRVFDMLDSVASQAAPNGYPPYNIEVTGENGYRITMALAGFTESEISIVQQGNQLVVSSEPKKKTVHSRRFTATPRPSASSGLKQY